MGILVVLRKRWIKIGLGLFISVFAIIFILKSVDLGQVWANLKKLSLAIIPVLILVYLSGMLIRAWRWKKIIEQRSPISYWLVFKALVFGYMINQLLPAKVGELARVEYLRDNAGQGRSFLLGTVVVERLFDLLVIFLFLGASVLFSSSLMSRLRSNILSVALFVIIAVMATVVLLNLERLKKLTQYLPGRIRIFVDKTIDRLAQSFKIFKDGKATIGTFINTLLIWGITCLMFYVIAQDLGIRIPAYAYLFLVSAGTFGMVIPSTSANIGVYHAIAMGALMLFMIPKEQALSFAIIAHAFDFFPAIILGGLILGYGGVKRLFQAYFFKRSDS